MRKIEEEHQKEITQIHQGLLKLDQTLPVFVPDLEWFELEVKNARVKSKKKFLRDIFIFWIIAVTIISFIFIILQRVPVVYFVLQLFVLFTMIIWYFSVNKKKQVDQL